MVDHSHHDDSGVIGTLQSVIVAFVLAMTFRGFVAEGFVIPTGSMAPTLMGQHAQLRSVLTGTSFPAGLDQSRRSDDPPSLTNAYDPMLGRNYPPPPGTIGFSQAGSRAGDRILVLKGLYSFSEPKRYDVVVFKNPTDPKGEAGNYIKRLIGLPNETIWLVDGDVFAKGPNDEEFQIQRKPEYIQRALWQPIYNSDYTLVHPGRLDRHYSGPPWRGLGWDLTGRSYRYDDASPTVLHWDNSEMRLDDWASYNTLGDTREAVPVSDLRVSAGIVADEAGVDVTLNLQSRRHVYEYSISGSTAQVRMRPSEDEDGWVASESASVPEQRPGLVRNVEFWHVDQSMRIVIDGEEVVRLDYEWSPEERLKQATGMELDRAVRVAAGGGVHIAELQWQFSGSPVTLHRVRVDRDLYYRSAELDSRRPNTSGMRGPGFGTSPEHLAELGDDQFFMLGDNSQASLDSRVWGNPHPIIEEQIDEAPFIVNRKLLLGKAWVVYFPAMYPITDRGPSLVPDFGRLRYIR